MTRPLPSEPLMLQPMGQLGEADCAVTALAMYLGRPYREVSEAAMRTSPHVHQRGLWATEMRRIAKRLGVTLRSVRAPVPNITERTGILCVKRKAVEHAAVLFQGVLIDPRDGQLWDLETWVATRCWKVTALLCLGGDV